VSFNPSTQLVAKNATFIGALGAIEEDSLTAIRVMEAGRLPLAGMVTHQMPLDRVADAITALNGDYRLDGRTAVKIAIAPNGPVA
jgi:L-iditol 2-dehydrogenase